jgi:hypothetical protein
VHNRVCAHSRHALELEGLARSITPSPVRLSGPRSTADAKDVVQTRMGRHESEALVEDERMDAKEPAARGLLPVPDPRRHLFPYYGPFRRTRHTAIYDPGIRGPLYTPSSQGFKLCSDRGAPLGAQSLGNDP